MKKTKPLANPRLSASQRSRPLEGNEPILVTGAHRSGTTWVGKMLAASDRVAYISEPLNILHRPGVFRVNTQYWYTYISRENEKYFLAGLQETLSFRYHLVAEIRSLRSRKDVLRMLRDAGVFFRGRLLHQRPLLKDPFAVFAAPWFAKRLGAQVIITIRHPAAFASSLKRLAWSFDFSDLLEQQLLMRDYLEPYRNDMQMVAKGDIIDQASLLWKMVYETVITYQSTYPHFIVVQHETLSRDPEKAFGQLYRKLRLPYTSKAQDTIRKASQSGNPKELSKTRVHATKLDSLANLDNWKHRLSEAEIARVHSITGETAAHYYPNETWN